MYARFLSVRQGKELFYRGQYDSSRPGNDTEVSGVDLADAIDVKNLQKALLQSTNPKYWL